jgi:four helix bundle protein
MPGMDRITDFRDLVAWRLAHELKLVALALCAKPALRTRFELRNQLSRAAESAPANIAEGFGRYYHPEAARFARIAKASEVEVLNHFIDAYDKGLLTDDEFAHHEHAVKKALKAINGWIRYLEDTPNFGKS